LVLTGGGARAAYQVGVLQTLAQLHRRSGAARHSNPFPILAGTSAGAITAAALACQADDFDHAVRRIARVWQSLHARHVYRADAISALRSGARWLTLLSLGWAMARWHRTRPRSLLDHAPLAALLRRTVPLQRLPQLFEQGHLQGLAVTASSYTTGEHVTFFDSGAPVPAWRRSQRRAERERITHQHLLASSAIPFVFPATLLEHGERREYFGDGAMRQTAPLSPAIHLGAERLLVVGAHHMPPPRQGPPAAGAAHYPSLAQMAGHALSSIFLDALPGDVERLERINTTLALLPQPALARYGLRPLRCVLITPSQPLDALALRHLRVLPPAVRALLGALGLHAGSADPRNAELASYLLFEPEYTRALMALGRADALARADELCALLDWPAPGAAPGNAAPPP